MATTTSSREPASSRATCPATAVFPTRLPVPITASAGLRVGREAHGVEPEVGADVREALRERVRREPEAPARADDGLVGEIDDHVHLDLGERLGERAPQRDAVVGRAVAELLGPAEHDRAHDLVAERGERLDDDVRVVLAVDQRQGCKNPFHCRPVSSVSIRAVYFSNSSVSIENWMIRSCPWKGYLRQTSTCLSSISIRL